jgi:hypothetical protein
MRPRHAVLPTPLESALPDCLPSCKQIAPLSPLEPTHTSPSQITENPATLSLAKSALTRLPPANPLQSALTKNSGVGGPFLPFWNSPHITRRSPLYSSSFFSDSCALFCTFLHPRKTQLVSFHAIPHSLQKTPGVGGGAKPSTRTRNEVTVPSDPRRAEEPLLARGECANSQGSKQRDGARQPRSKNCPILRNFSYRVSSSSRTG